MIEYLNYDGRACRTMRLLGCWILRVDLSRLLTGIFSSTIDTTAGDVVMFDSVFEHMEQNSIRIFSTGCLSPRLRLYLSILCRY